VQGAAGTNKNRKSDSLKEYEDEEPMTTAEINTGEPTAVSRNPNDQKITEEGKTSPANPQANEEYRKRGMTKIEDNK
jgi:hypothetical protein